jgi:hypothetical protein
MSVTLRKGFGANSQDNVIVEDEIGNRFSPKDSQIFKQNSRTYAKNYGGGYIFYFQSWQERNARKLLQELKIPYYDQLVKLSVSNYDSRHAIVRGKISQEANDTFQDLNAVYLEKPIDGGTAGFLITNKNAEIFLQNLERKRIPHTNNFVMPPVETILPEEEPVLTSESTITLSLEDFDDLTNSVRELLQKLERLSSAR